MQRTTAIIGAGMAGIAAAERLAAAGRRVVMFEKSSGVGGRVATRRVQGCIVDHGAQVVKPVGTALEHRMFHALSTVDLVEVPAPVRTVSTDGAIQPEDPHYGRERKFTYRYGLTQLPKLILAGISPERFSLRAGTRIASILEEQGSVLLCDAGGRELLRADEVLLTAPAPQSADLLSGAAVQDPEQMLSRIDALRSVAYNPCLTVLLGYGAPTPEAPAYALLAEDRSRPLLWLAFEQVKDPARAPAGEAVLIAQLGPAASRELYAAPDDAAVALALDELRRIFGAAYARPCWQQVKRWRYSQPVGGIEFAAANPAGARIVVCGDGLRPDNGRIHQAYCSGIEAAERLLAIF